MRKIVLSLLLVTGLGLSGCSQMRDELGLARHSPDEFTVVKRAPLTLPPDYNLRPPADGSALGAGRKSASADARTAIFGGESGNTEDQSSGNEVFLSKVGAQEADSSIRTVLDRESGYVPVEKRSTIEKILRRKPDSSNSIVDAKAEAERLQNNADADRPLTEGETPVAD